MPVLPQKPKESSSVLLSLFVLFPRDRVFHRTWSEADGQYTQGILLCRWSFLSWQLLPNNHSEACINFKCYANGSGLSPTSSQILS